MDYVVPLYVVLLTAMTYLIVELHDRDVRPIVWCWKPFRRCTHHFRRNWNVKHSLIETFATLLLLSYSKLATFSIRLLNRVLVYNVKGERVGINFYYDGSVKYFGSEHAPFAVLAILVLVIISIPSLILTFYQFKPFQWCLEHCRLCTPRVQSGLSAFVDSYQGCFKEKYRFFAGVYFILRIIVASADTDDTFSSRYLRHFVILLLFRMALTFTLLQPYKKKKHNFIDTLLFANLASLYFFLLIEVFLTLLSRKSPFLPLASILMVLPLVYYSSIGSPSKKVCLNPVRRSCTVLRAIIINEETQAVNDHSDESLPDRVVHPESYQATSYVQMLPNVKT